MSKLCPDFEHFTTAGNSLWRDIINLGPSYQNRLRHWNRGRTIGAQRGADYIINQPSGDPGM